ncbi:MAG: hypothetical protein R6U32_03835 [Candidatus Woesearchaeota archaeon]
MRLKKSYHSERLMLRVIFDTNIYGFLLKEKDAAEIEEKIIEDKQFLVYGYGPIRKEIRDIPKITRLSRKSRIFLLNLYDRMTEGHFIKHSINITNLAKNIMITTGILAESIAGIQA